MAFGNDQQPIRGGLGLAGVVQGILDNRVILLLVEDDADGWSDYGSTQFVQPVVALLAGRDK